MPPDFANRVDQRSYYGNEEDRDDDERVPLMEGKEVGQTMDQRVLGFDQMSQKRRRDSLLSAHLSLLSKAGGDSIVKVKQQYEKDKTLYETEKQR